MLTDTQTLDERDALAWDEHDRAERRQLRERVTAALERLRLVEDELEEIAIELSAGERVGAAPPPQR